MEDDRYVLDFELPVKELEHQIQQLEQTAKAGEINFDEEILKLKKRVGQLTQEIYANLDSWQKVLLSRHPNRPHSLDFIHSLFTNFYELHGDRQFSDDPSLVTGLGIFEGKKVAIVAIEKGRKTKEKILRNFGMPRPEGYRKAYRLMEMAQQFNLPIITFIDTPGAYPGIDAEERGQACAIAENLEFMCGLTVPVISVVIGEGGSGGALAIGVANEVLMLEYSVYSVISPESCASILWSDAKMASTAANSLKLDPKTALSLGVIEAIVPEPLGGAHRVPEKTFESLRVTLGKTLQKYTGWTEEELVSHRLEKFRKMGNQTLAYVNKKEKHEEG